MVEHRDADEVPRFMQPFGDDDILPARARVPARMLVTGDDARGIVQDGALEHFPWVHDTRVDAPDVRSVDADDPVLRVEHDDEEHLAVVIPDERCPDLPGIVGGLDNGVLEGDHFLANLLLDTDDLDDGG